MPELIDKAKVLKFLTPRIKTETPYGEGYNRALEDAAELVALMPTIEPEVRRGHWIPVDGEPYAKCSYCGEKHYGCTTPYCDMCGAYMRKEGESDA